MTTPTTDPEPMPTDARPGPHGLLRATAVIATVGVVVALLGLVLLLVPVSTPTQDCGTSIGFLLEGRVNELVSETDPPRGVTPAEAKANNATPCRERVAGRTKPAAVLLGAGLVSAIGATLFEAALRTTAWMKRRRTARSTVAPEAPTSRPQRS